ncbi:1460_t:CDS:2, partial [Acaulospora morrowiae]
MFKDSPTDCLQTSERRTVWPNDSRTAQQTASKHLNVGRYGLTTVGIRVTVNPAREFKELRGYGLTLFFYVILERSA